MSENEGGTMPAAAAPLTKLKDRHLACLAAIAGWRGPGVPLATDLAKALGYSDESGVRYTLQQLEAEGYLRLVRNHHRTSPELTNKGLQLVGVPQPTYQVGRSFPFPVYPIACGALKEAIAEPTFLDSPADMFESWRPDDYLLRGDGDSMVDGEAGIHADAWIQVRPGLSPNNGDIVHAEYVVDGRNEVTLKQFYLDGDRVTLHPLNRAYPDIVLSAEQVEVRGVVVETLRPCKHRGLKK
jgi:SOS-response transcriptional repressor LexA